MRYRFSVDPPGNPDCSELLADCAGAIRELAPPGHPYLKIADQAAEWAVPARRWVAKFFEDGVEVGRAVCETEDDAYEEALDWLDSRPEDPDEME